MAETLPSFAAAGWQVLLAPAGTPADIVNQANTNLTKALHDAEVRQRLDQLVREVQPMSPEETLAFIQDEQKKWKPIVTRVTEAH